MLGILKESFPLIGQSHIWHFFGYSALETSILKSPVHCWCWLCLMKLPVESSSIYLSSHFSFFSSWRACAVLQSE